MNNSDVKIAIASGKGGTGKTLFSTNLFDALVKINENVVLVDCDAEEPNDMLFFNGKLKKQYQVLQQTPIIDSSVCTFCGKCHEYCNYKAIFYLPAAKMIKVFDELCHGCGACSVACEFGAITERPLSLGVINDFEINKKAHIIEARMNIGVMTPVPLIKSAIKQATGYNIKLYDAPPGTSCPFIHTVLNADYVILITEPTPFGLNDLKQSVETLKTINKNYGVVINRAGLGTEELYNYISENKIELLMEIPYDVQIAYNYSQGSLINDYLENFPSDLIKIFNSIRKKYGTRNN